MRLMMNSSEREEPASFGQRPASLPPLLWHQPQDVANTTSPFFVGSTALAGEEFAVCAAGELPDCAACATYGSAKSKILPTRVQMKNVIFVISTFRIGTQIKRSEAEKPRSLLCHSDLYFKE